MDRLCESSFSGKKRAGPSLDDSFRDLSKQHESDDMFSGVQVPRSQLPRNTASLPNPLLLDYARNASVQSEDEELQQFVSDHTMPESGMFSWEDDLFRLSVASSSDLMHHPEIGTPIDESDGGSSSNLPGCSGSSKYFKSRKTSDQKQGCNIQGNSLSESATENPYSFTFVQSNSSSMPSPFSFDDSDSDIDQCTSSSELFVSRQETKQPTVIKSEQTYDVKAEHSQCTPERRTSSKVIPYINSEHSSLKFDAFLKTPLTDQIFDTDSECSQEDFLCNRVAESVNASGLVKEGIIEADNLQLLGMSSDSRQPIKVVVGSDQCTSSSADESGTSGSQGRIHQFPSDILKTISPSKVSATIMAQPQPMDIDLQVHDSIPSTTTAVYTGDQCAGNQTVSKSFAMSDQLLILAPVIGSVDSSHQDNTKLTSVMPGSSSASNPNVAASQLGSTESLGLSGTSVTSTADSFSTLKTSNTFTSNVISSSGPQDPSSRDWQDRQQTTVEAMRTGDLKSVHSNISSPMDVDCIEQFDFQNEDLEGMLHYMNHTSSKSEHLEEPPREEVQNTRMASTKMKSFSLPTSLSSAGEKSDAASDLHKYDSVQVDGLSLTKFQTHQDRDVSISDSNNMQARKIASVVESDGVREMESRSSWHEGTSSKLVRAISSSKTFPLESKATEPSNISTSFQKCDEHGKHGKERTQGEVRSDRNLQPAGKQNFAKVKTVAKGKENALLKDARNTPTISHPHEKKSQASGVVPTSKKNTKPGEGRPDSSALGSCEPIRDTADPNRNDNNVDKGETAKKEMEVLSDDSDGDIDIDDLLDEGLKQQGEGNKGNKRMADGEVKGGDNVFKRSKMREPKEDEREQGVVSVRDKIILKKRGRDPLEGLPENWMAITHRCGIDVYIHKPSRVCTWSRPYFLGPGSVRKHNVPLASVPCLHYRKAKDDELGNASGTTGSSQDQTKQPSKSHSKPEASKGSGRGDTSASCELAGTAGKAPSGDQKGKEIGSADSRFKNKLQLRPDEALDPGELHEYCKKLFDFEEVTIRKFQTWAARRQFWKQQKAKDVVDRPQLPAVPTYEIEIPNLEGNVSKKRELVMNIQDKSPIAVLHEYCQKVLRVHPKFKVEESNNSNFPFEAVVFVDETKYGRGQAQNKKAAKIKAAQETLEILLPRIMNQQKGKEEVDLMEFFNQISIDDPRVADLCLKTGNLAPFAVLQDYKQRMHGKKDMELNFNVTVTGHHSLSYQMSLGPYSVSGPCKNSKSGKQIGAQLILKQIYPKVTTWGGIIKMYGKGVTEISKAKREEEKKILALSNKPKNKPNEKILQKLQEEMRKIYGKKESNQLLAASSSLSSSRMPNPSTSKEAAERS